MPFVKVGPDRYRGPSGRIFTRAQVRRYHARGGHFDAAARLRDPTRTAGIRSAMATDFRRRYRQLRRSVTEQIGEVDAFGLLSTPGAGLGTAGRLSSLAAWLRLGADTTLLAGEGEWMRPYLQKSRAVAARRTGSLLPLMSEEGLDGLVEHARADLRGIVEAAVQRGVREFFNGMVQRRRPQAVARAVAQQMDRVVLPRAMALVNTFVVRAHADATLEALRATGVRWVGLIPEARPRTHTHDAPRRRPAAGLIRRAQRARTRLSRIQGAVAVQTAGDEDVCPQCERISRDGPYDIDRAQGLIPAHPNCRCLFVPASDFGGE